MKIVLQISRKNYLGLVVQKTSGMATDLSEKRIREFALHMVVDIKDCAVSNKWSGLKLVLPVAER